MRAAASRACYTHYLAAAASAAATTAAASPLLLHLFGHLFVLFCFFALFSSRPFSSLISLLFFKFCFCFVYIVFSHRCYLFPGLLFHVLGHRELQLLSSFLFYILFFLLLFFFPGLCFPILSVHFLFFLSSL
jgi:hypothetical protein